MTFLFFKALVNGNEQSTAKHPTIPKIVVASFAKIFFPYGRLVLS